MEVMNNSHMLCRAWVRVHQLTSHEGDSPECLLHSDLRAWGEVVVGVV